MAADFKPCSIDGCKGNAHRSASGRGGHCNKHARRIAKHGDPHIGGRHGAEWGEAQSFISDVSIPYVGGDCLLWPYATNAKGYAIARIDGVSQLVHRYVCRAVKGEPPSSDMEAAHNCGVRGCVNPHHLRWDTHAGNQADRLQHGTTNRGERCGRAILTERDVREIRASWPATSKAELARRYGVSFRCISQVLNRTSWAWLDGEEREA